MRSTFSVVALTFAAANPAATIAADPERTNAVGEALGKNGSPMPGGICHIGLPRSDLKVTLDGVEIKSALPVLRVMEPGRLGGR